MKTATRREIEQALGAPAVEYGLARGGDINDAHALMLSDGRKVFVKTNPASDRLSGLFAAEAAGLGALSGAADELGVPRVIAWAESFLVLDWIDLGAKPDDFDERLGRGLAQMHRSSCREGYYGFERPTYLGRLRQENTPADGPAAFWRDRRLVPLLDWLGAYPQVVRCGRTLAARLESVLDGPDEPATLVHGDLWSGNAGADADGGVWIYDPACFYGCREVEFGMTRLFGFGGRFEAAYQEQWPLAEGWERRVEVYRLHHLLSHLWHFGGDYEAQCLAALDRLV